jgi:hypothetical protein
LKRYNHWRLKFLLCVGALMATTWLATAAPILDTGDPLRFFTNAASRLLATELNLDLTRIQIYPTNQYTPAVQRLLQVAANIYDATTNHTAVLGQDFPSVFRPLFTRDISGSVFITGYTNVPSVSGVGDIVFSVPFDPQQLAVPTLASIPVNVYGVPWIIGAKKGFPNFNEFSMDNVVNITRKMQVTRSDLTSTATMVATNVAYVFSISNSIGVEFWDSYTNDYTNTLVVVVNDNLTMNLTNEFGFSQVSYFPISSIGVVNPWSRSTWNNDGSLNTNISNPFYIPLTTNVAYLPTSVYQWGGGFLPAGNTPWQTARTDLVLPHFGLLTTNRLQAFVLARDANGNQHVIDYVHFNGPDSMRDLNAEIQTTMRQYSYNNMWDPGLNNRGIPWGIASQVSVSQGFPSFNSGYWINKNLAIAEIDGFTAFMGGTPTMPVPSGYENVYNSFLTNYTVQVPFTPTVTAYQYTSWQANDPLVHYLSSDLNFSDTVSVPHIGTNLTYSPPNYTLPPLLPNIGMLNNRFLPWGKVRTYSDSINNPYDTTLKDPLVRRSDDWNFPTGQSGNPGWIGQIHRGTPWQTIYLKSTNILSLGSGSGINTWEHWTGITNSLDATNTAPVRDWHIASLITALLNTNDLASLLSVNNPSPAAWQGLLNGLTAYTNLPDQFDPILISSNSIEASVIANAIQSKRSAQPGQFFKDAGDVFATTQLSEQSPFLAGLNATNQITDAAYEIIPSQLLLLLRSDSIGSVALNGNESVVQFTGYDGHAYAIQSSADLANWTSICTNCPVNGGFNLTNSATLNAGQQIYRSLLLH